MSKRKPDGPEAKKERAFALTDKFLAEIKAEYHDDRDESMVLMIAVARFICREQADPVEFLDWFNDEVLLAIERASRRQMPFNQDGGRA